MEPTLVETLQARLISEYYKRTEYLVRLGCQICGETATHIGRGPTQEFSMVGTPDGGVVLRLTETLIIRCVDHTPSTG